jgi:hypothetical protein
MRKRNKSAGKLTMKWERSPQHTAASEQIFEEWPMARNLGKHRNMRDVGNKDTFGPLTQTQILPGVRWNEFVEPPLFPVEIKSEKWTLYLTDFVMDSYLPQQLMLERAYSKNDVETTTPNRTCLRYHGCSLYAASDVVHEPTLPF